MKANERKRVSRRSGAGHGRSLLDLPEVPLRKFVAGARLQVAFESEGSCFVAKRHDDIQFPGSMPPCVKAFAGIVRRQSRSNVRCDADVVAISIAEASEHIHEALRSDHDRANATFIPSVLPTIRDG